MTTRTALDAATAQTTGAPTLTITIPGTPPRELSPNASLHLKAGHRNRLRAELQHDWYYAALDAVQGQALPLFTGPTRCQITVYRGKGAQPWDADNLLASLKHGLDQLQNAGVIENDKLLVFLPITQERDPEGRGCVVVMLSGGTR